jgi:beta-glucanase (GH16 family)
MKKLSLLLLLAGSIAQAQVKKGKLVWEENFNGDSLSTKTWNFETGNGCPNNCGFGNAEKQTYTTTNHKVANGFLTITAKKEADGYSSTRITTEGKKEFKYGYMEARLKLPKGKGIWPAFWMLGGDIDKAGWPLAGEIDIMEYVGREPHMAYATVHTVQTHGANANGNKMEFKDLEEGFHTFGALWTENKITFYVDDVEIHSFTSDSKSAEIWPFNKPFYFIINCAVGGYFGGMEVDDTIFPQEYVIDYVRVYEAQ